jgi:3-oxoacyl-[acyl-carrier-protein] synthase II
MIASTAKRRRVVITGLGLISPLGNSPAEYWSALDEGRSGVALNESLSGDRLRLAFSAEARGFTGRLEDFGELPKERQKAIRKALKVMCRETQMAVAAAQLAIANAGCTEGFPDPDRAGVLLGSDYMLTIPEDYTEGIQKCEGKTGNFEFGRWGNDGLGEMAPLWMLKYLPNMPASHIAILNDLRGPNNSLTMREASSNLAVGEAFRTIRRGHADWMVAGATGTRILPMQALHAMQTEQLADASLSPTEASRPFDKSRTGMVLGEGAAMVILEELELARSRGANIYAEILGLGSSNVSDSRLRGRCDMALASAARTALRDAKVEPGDVGHVNAHGLATTAGDRSEAMAIGAVFGPRTATLPVTALKSYFGNLGAAAGIVEMIASILSWQHSCLPRVLNYRTPDPDCPVAVVADDRLSPGRTFLNFSVTPQGQAAVLLVGQVD